jgi:hypothetical protein
MAMTSSTNCYLCDKPLEALATQVGGAGYCAIEVGTGKTGYRNTVGVHDKCLQTHNRMLSREAFLRATNRRIQSKTP